jgi:nucleoside-diphosphate-sugar epimerase
MERILVTGGAGYLGSILVPELLKTGYKVTVLDNFYFDQTPLSECCADSNFDVIRGDCRDEKILASALKNADIIIPLAALVGAPMCSQDVIGANSLNYGAIKSLVTMRSSDQRILYPTTNSGYGLGEKGKFCTEESPLNPLSLYGRTKVDAEKAVLDSKNAITFRLATVFGAAPRMRLDLLVNDFVYRAVNDKAVVLFEGHFKRNYIHVRDVAATFIHGIKNFDQMKNQPYNVGLSEANLSKLELCQKIKEFVPQFLFLESTIGEDLDKRDYMVSNERLEKTGWKPKHSVDMGVKELIKFFKIARNSKYSNV